MFGIICKDTETPDAGVKLNQVRSEGAAAGTRGSLAPGQTHPALDQPTKSQISRDFAAEINTCSTRSLACIFFLDHMLSSSAPPCKHSSAPHLSASWPVLSRHF